MARKSLRLPKRVGGVKLPKKARQMGNSVLAHPLGREILAGVLVQAGSAMMRRQAEAGSASRQFLSHPVASTRSAGGAVAEAGADAASTVGQAAGSLSTLILDAFDGVMSRLNGDRKTKKAKAPKRNGGKSKGSAKKSRKH
ncbi:MAG: hypothetical protein H7X89_06225 [Rhizobiales bacterium]|nr:hypothetical protein [Hyphomicrobiales bacterium]